MYIKELNHCKGLKNFVHILKNYMCTIINEILDKRNQIKEGILFLIKADFNWSLIILMQICKYIFCNKFLVVI